MYAVVSPMLIRVKTALGCLLIRLEKRAEPQNALPCMANIPNIPSLTGQEICWHLLSGSCLEDTAQAEGWFYLWLPQLRIFTQLAAILIVLMQVLQYYFWCKWCVHQCYSVNWSYFYYTRPAPFFSVSHFSAGSSLISRSCAVPLPLSPRCLDWQWTKMDWHLIATNTVLCTNLNFL